MQDLHDSHGREARRAGRQTRPSSARLDAATIDADRSRHRLGRTEPQPPVHGRGRGLERTAVGARVEVRVDGPAADGQVLAVKPGRDRGASVGAVHAVVVRSGHGLVPQYRRRAVDDLTALLNDARSGDRVALTAFVRATQSEVWRLARHLVGPDDADEVTQDTYVRAWKALPSFRGDSSARTWLLAIARRACADAVRRHTRRRRPAPGRGAARGAEVADVAATGGRPARAGRRPADERRRRSC